MSLHASRQVSSLGNPIARCRMWPRRQRQRLSLELTLQSIGRKAYHSSQTVTSRFLGWACLPADKIIYVVDRFFFSFSFSFSFLTSLICLGLQSHAFSAADVGRNQSFAASRLSEDYFKRLKAMLFEFNRVKLSVHSKCFCHV